MAETRRRLRRSSGWVTSRDAMFVLWVVTCRYQAKMSPRGMVSLSEGRTNQAFSMR